MIKIIKKSNMIVAKLLNRRIAIVPNERNGFDFYIVKRTDELTPHFLHGVVKDKIVVTSFSLSEEATKALYIALSEYMRDIKFEPKVIDSKR